MKVSRHFAIALVAFLACSSDFECVNGAAVHGASQRQLAHQQRMAEMRMTRDAMDGRFEEIVAGGATMKHSASGAQWEKLKEANSGILEFFESIAGNDTKITRAEFLKAMLGRFDELDVDKSGDLGFNEFLALFTNPADPTVQLETSQAKSVELKKLVKSFKKVPTASLVEKAWMAFLLFALSITNLLFNAKYVGQYESGIYTGGVAPMATMLGVNSFISLLVFTGITKITGRRLNKDPAKRVLYDGDKPAFSWMLLTLTVNLITAYSTEVYWSRVLVHQKMSVDDASGVTDPGGKFFSHSLTTLILNVFLVILFISKTFSKQQDPFFQGMARTYIAHTLVWVAFAYLIMYHGEVFNISERPKVSKMYDALYIAGITHTTVGYGEFGYSDNVALRRIGRKIQMFHAFIVLLINFVAGFAFVLEVGNDDPTYNPSKSNERKAQALTLLCVGMLIGSLFFEERDDVDSKRKSMVKLHTVMYIVSLFITLASCKFIYSVMERRIKGLENQMYSDDLNVLAWSWACFAIGLLMLSAYEDDMYRSRINVDAAYPFVSIALLVLMTMYIIKATFKMVHHGYASDAIGLSATLVMNLGILYSFAIAYFVTRSNYSGIENFFDALYYAVITHTTVGFGDINGGENFTAHQVTLAHVLTVFFLNICSVASLMPDHAMMIQKQLLADAGEDGEVDDKKLAPMH